MLTMIGCAALSVDKLDPRFGAASPKEYVATATPAPVEYER
jgi:hypothetical protein